MNEIKIGLDEFRALSSDTRISIIKMLHERNYTLSEMSKKLSMSSPTIKQHLETLVKSDLIEQKDEGRKWKYYSLTRKGKKLIEPDSQPNIMILLGGSFILLVAVALVLFGSGLMNEPGNFINEPANQNKELHSADSLLAGTAASPDTQEITDLRAVIASQQKEIKDVKTEVEKNNQGIKDLNKMISDKNYGN